MCTYARTIFKCNHAIWGTRIKLCGIAADHRAGRLPHDCAVRHPHAIKSRSVDQQCRTCKASHARLDMKLALAKKTVAECRRVLQKYETQQGEGRGDGKEKLGEEPGLSGDETEASQIGSDGSISGKEGTGSDTTVSVGSAMMKIM